MSIDMLMVSKGVDFLFWILVLLQITILFFLLFFEFGLFQNIELGIIIYSIFTISAILILILLRVKRKSKNR